ncbi:PepSY-like domain-containing protein [Algibacter lectus]|uniref:Putative PepSY-like beta-lactamase-inhibitor n=1 Tax=Algibacter lectus TaxID=221126 RepID=A0A4R8M9M6_9FLAO|nr:PepSY-like domain-containing protein [Algibacter lectus]MWW26019.1 hypothetical protein [Algibacter lectus]TDY60747.1 putative PepSY-like beta-lactamase-inhibitor [Algibacter lectus]
MSFKLIFIFFIVSSCSIQAPTDVQESFEKQFKNAEDISYRRENDTVWQVSFYQEKFHYKTVAYTGKGNWLFTRTKISDGDVPNEVLLKLKKQFPKSFLIQSFQKITGTGNHYEFEIEDNGLRTLLECTVKNELVILENETYRLRNDFIIEND